MEGLKKKLLETKLVPVIKINHIKNAIPLAKCLKNVGINVIEITFRTDLAADAIKLITEELPDMIVLAGTVLDVETAKKAKDSGAYAIVSPGINLETINWCKNNNIDIIPGIATPTELEIALRESMSIVKVFPAESLGGARYIKSLSEVYDGVEFMPTGGINSENINQYLDLDKVICCGGSWVIAMKYLEKENYLEFEKYAKKEYEKIFC